MVPSSKFDASPSVDFGQRYTLASDTLQLGKAYIAVLLAQMWKKSAKISDFFILWKLWDFLICKILTSKQFFWPKIISTLYNVWFWHKMSRFSSHFANGHIKSNPERSLAILQVKHDWDMSVLGWVTVCLPPFCANDSHFLSSRIQSVLLRSCKLSMIGTCQYLDGWPSVYLLFALMIPTFSKSLDPEMALVVSQLSNKFNI